MCHFGKWKCELKNNNESFILTNIFLVCLFASKSAVNSKHSKVSEWKVKSLSRVWLFATPWTVAYQAPPSIGFSRQEYWNGLPFPSPGGLPDPGIEPASPAGPVLAGGFFTTQPPGKSSSKELNVI